MRRRVIPSVLATAMALGTAAACGARDDAVDVEFDPGSGGDLGTGAIGGSNGRGGGARGGTPGRGGSFGRVGSFGSDGVGGSFGAAGSGRGGTSGTAGAFGSGGIVVADGSVGRGGSSGRGGTGGFDGSVPDGSFPDGSPPDGSRPDSSREDCMNGRDDDGDNLLDCADPDCNAGFACTPPAPAGWLGPAALWQGTDVPPFTLCPDNGYQQPLGGGWVGIIADPAECADCTCGAPEGVFCAASFNFHDQSSCGGQTLQTSISANYCQAIRLRFDAKSVRWESAPARGGACRPGTDGDSTLPPVRWSNYAAACYNPRPGGGCSSGSCLPRPAPPFGVATCITQTGDVACPSPYTQRYLYYGGVLDNRSCSACSCASPSGGACAGSAVFASNDTCSSDRVTLATVGTCAELGSDPTPPDPPSLHSRSVIYTANPTNGGTCTPSGGAPVGSAEATNPITYCCMSAPAGGRFKLPGLRPVDAGAG
jgi:hypothetical protein